MNKFLLLLPILATLNLGAQLRTSDSTTVSNAALRRILTAAEQKKVLEEQILLLNGRIDNCELMIDEYARRDTATVGSYERQIAVMRDQRKLFEGEILRLEKEIKRYKRKLFWRTVGSVGIMVALTTLYITK